MADDIKRPRDIKDLKARLGRGAKGPAGGQPPGQVVPSGEGVGDAASAGVYFLGAYCLMTLSLAPFAAAAALRISNE